MTNKITKNNCHRFIVFTSILGLLFVNIRLLEAQEMYGVTFSDYNGISSTMLNPALMTGSRSYLDVNIVSGDIFLDNSMFYLPASFNWIPKFTSGVYNLQEGEFKYGRSYNYYDNTNEKYSAASVKIMGPSAMIQIGKHAFGLSISSRTNQSGKGIPYEIPIIAYEDINYEKYHRIEFNDYNANLAAMSWGEIGLSYAYDLLDHLDNRLTIGATVKGLLGMAGAYIEARNIDYILVDSETLNIINLDADFGFSMPIDPETSEPDFNPMILGLGLGADFGIVYTKKRSKINYEGERKICAKPYQDYIFKIGVSLLDFGSITFKNKSELHRYDNVSRYWEHFDTLKFNDLHQTLQDISTGFYGDPDASYIGNKIHIALPTTISLQFDYHFDYNLYLGFVWQHPLTILKNTIWNPSQIAVIPRYESRFFGLSMPVSIFNYSKIRYGISVRFYSFTIGTDNLGSWLGAGDFTGSDIYFSFKFNLNKGKCLSTKKGACYNKSFGKNK